MRIRAVSLVVAVVVLGVTLVSSTQPAQAASLTWDGGAGSASWSAAGNWNPDQVPTASDDLVFAGAATNTSPDLCNLGSPVFSLSSVTFASTGHDVQDNCVVQNVDLINSAGTNTYGTKLCGTIEVVNNGTLLNVPGTLQSACATAILHSGPGTTSFTGTWDMNPSVTVSGGVLMLSTPTNFRSVTTASVAGGLLSSAEPIGNLQVGPAGTFSPLDPGGGVAPWTNVGTGDVAGTLALDLVAPGLEERVLTNGGALDIDGATLDLVEGPAFAQNAHPGDEMILIQSLNGGTRTGTFAGLPEGATVTLGGIPWRISYLAGPNQQEVTLTASEAISIGDPVAAVSEGGGAALSFPITLSNPVGSPFTVDVSTTAGGTATSGADYVSTTQQFEFLAGQTTVSFDVPVSDDLVDEADLETVTASITAIAGDGATEVAIGDADATGQIQDDEGPPTVSVGDGSVTEGDGGGSTDLVLPVTLSHASSQNVTVDFDTGGVAGEAQVGADYTGTNGQVAFAPGETSKEIRVPVLHDDLGEDDEVFNVSLYTPAGATLDDDGATATIVDDDPVTASIADDTVDPEGDAGVSVASVQVTLSGPHESEVTFTLERADGTAVGGTDYAFGGGSVTVLAGETTRAATTDVIGDLLDEPDETFGMSISEPTVPVQIVDGTGEITIVDDDDPPTLSIADVAVDPEGDAGTTDAAFIVSLDAPSGQAVAATVTVAGATAVASSDLTVPPGTTVTIPIGATQVPFVVPVAGDLLDEEDETFTVTLSAPDNATLADAGATGTIVDDDDPPTLSVLDAAVAESGNASIHVQLSAPSGKEVSVHAATANGTATNAPDYVTTATTLVFAPGATSATLSVPIGTDGDDEPDETFTVTLTDPVNATIAETTATITITDDDLAPGAAPSTPAPAAPGSTPSATPTASPAIAASGGEIARTGSTGARPFADGVAWLLAGAVVVAHARRRRAATATR